MKMDEATIERIRGKLAEVCPEVPALEAVLIAVGRERGAPMRYGATMVAHGDWTDDSEVLRRAVQAAVEPIRPGIPVVLLDECGPRLLLSVARTGEPLYERAARACVGIKLMALKMREEMLYRRRMWRRGRRSGPPGTPRSGVSRP